MVDSVSVPWQSGQYICWHHRGGSWHQPPQLVAYECGCACLCSWRWYAEVWTARHGHTVPLCQLSCRGGHLPTEHPELLLRSPVSKPFDQLHKGCLNYSVFSRLAISVVTLYKLQPSSGAKLLAAFPCTYPMVARGGLCCLWAYHPLRSPWRLLHNGNEKGSSLSSHTGNAFTVKGEVSEVTVCNLVAC